MGNGGNRDAGSAEWFLLREGKQHGPVSEQELWELQKSGRVRPSDLLWRGGWSDWVAAHSVFASGFQMSQQTASSSPASRLESPTLIGTPLKALCILALASMGTSLIFGNLRAAIGGLLVAGAALLIRVWFPPR
jgi:GYF domain 2